MANKQDYETFKSLMFGEMKAKLVEFANAVPKEEAYSKYNKEFETVLEMIDEKAEGMPCLVKLTLTLKQMEEVAKMLKSDDSEVSHKIKEIYRQHKDDVLGEKVKVAFEKALEVDSSETDEDYC